MDHSHSEEEIERCTLRGRREIVFHLRSLIKEGERLSVIFQEGRQSFLTVLIDIAEDSGTLYFDIGGSNELNQAFLKCAQSHLRASVDGIQIQFALAQSRETKLRGERVFAAALPKSMLRLQRREFYRVALPAAKPYTCTLARDSDDEKTLPLHDISLGGVGILASTALDYQQLQRIENCRIDLREAGFLDVTLEVRYVAGFEGRNGKPLWHLGGRFVGLRAADEMAIQRFMARIDAERRALANG